MQDQNKWLDFMAMAGNIVRAGQKVEWTQFVIHVIVEPSFANSFSLQLCWSNEQVRWYRTTWNRLADIQKFTNPIEGLKYIGKTLSPTILEEKGEIPLLGIQHIVDDIQRLSIIPDLTEANGWVLDGCNYRLRIGNSSVKMEYQWHFLPDNWMPLQKIAGDLEDLNKTL